MSLLQGLRKYRIKTGHKCQDGLTINWQVLKTPMTSDKPWRRQTGKCRAGWRLVCRGDIYEGSLSWQAFHWAPIMREINEWERNRETARAGGVRKNTERPWKRWSTKIAREEGWKYSETLNIESDRESVRVFSYKCPWFGALCGQVHWFPLKRLKHTKHIDGQLAKLHLQSRRNSTIAKTNSCNLHNKLEVFNHLHKKHFLNLTCYVTCSVLPPDCYNCQWWVHLPRSAGQPPCPVQEGAHPPPATDWIWPPRRCHHLGS